MNRPSDPVLANLMVRFGEEYRVEAMPKFGSYYITDGVVQYCMDQVMAEFALDHPEAVDFARASMQRYRAEHCS